MPRRRALIAVAVPAAAAVLAVSGWAVLRPDPAPQHHRAVAAAPPARSTPAPAPPTTSAAPPPARPAVPHDAVAPAVPTRFTITGHGFHVTARVCSMAPVFPLDPPGEQHHTVCWVTRGFGVRPGSATGTSYLLGHSWAPDPQEVLNPVSAPATRDLLRARAAGRVRLLDGIPTYVTPSLLGARLALRTGTGLLTYQVRDAYAVAKSKLGHIARVMDQQVPGRVLVFTCAERGGVDYDYNIVLDARLIASKRT